MPYIDGVATVVEDMERTLGFYRILGFDIPRGAGAEGHVTIDLGNGFRFSWNTAAVERTFNPGWEPPTRSGRMGITLRCVDAAEVDSVFRTVVNSGHTSSLEPFDAPWGSRHCRVLDPDGNAIDLFAPLD